MARLASPDVLADEAERIMVRLDREAVTAVPWVYRWLHEAESEREVHAATQVLGRWLDAPLAPALAPALRAMIRDPEPGDLAKLAAAALLEKMNEPVDDAALGESLGSPRALAGRALRAALQAAETPAAAIRLVETAAEMPRAGLLALVDDLVRIGAPRSSRLLGPLSHDRDGEVAVAAVAAADLLGLADCAPLVALAAGHHPDPEARRQAARTLLRLEARYPAVAPGATRALVGGAPQSGAGIVMVVCRRYPAVDDATSDVLAVVAGERDGVREYAVAEMLSETEVVDLARRFEVGGVALQPAEAAVAGAALWAASARTLDAGGTRRLGYLAWPFLLGAGPAPTA